MMKEIRYAVVDRCVEPALLDKVNEYETKAWCLFPSPVDEEFALVAPYLIVVNDALQAWLQPKTKPWGFFFHSSTPIQPLRAHLRALMDGVIEGSDQRLFLRYYDPRILWVLLDSFDDLRLNHFLGPIKLLQTYFPQERSTDFAQQRTNWRSFGYITPKPLIITPTQYQQVLQTCQQNIVAEVIEFFGSSQKDLFWDFPQKLVQSCFDWNISLLSQIKTIAQCCADLSILEWDNFPETWTAILSDTQYSPDYRIIHLHSQIRSTYGL